jgi:choline kinase
MLTLLCPAVSIAPQTEVISPLILGNRKEVDDLDLDPSSGRQSKRNSIVKKPSSKRLYGRLPYSTSSPTLRPKSSKNESSGAASEQDSSHSRSESRHSGHHLEHLIDQVQQWIKAEREKQAQRRGKRHSSKQRRDEDEADHEGSNSTVIKQDDGDSVDSLDLDQLQSIIEHNLKSERRSRYSRHRSPTGVRHRPSLAKLRKASSASDTDNLEPEISVPTCDVVLDNSKTLSYTGGASDDSGVSSADELERSVSYRDQEGWALFKFEIVRLSHTLRLKGWRRVPMENSHEIEVQRLSGAMTNAVYEVSPPANMPTSDERESSGNGTIAAPKKPPPKLLLRIYGPNVDHLIDREKELAILRRLARKKIGPSLLGTFANGRFEEYLNAAPLTPEDLRCPDTSRQIAKRMRELHDGIKLEEQERDNGPFVWQNWDKWFHRLGKIVSWLDCQVAKLEPGAKPTGNQAWKRRGYICGAPWQQFRDMVGKYRKWLNSQYGGRRHVRELLVFAHNDTQYGNILRLKPTGQSPLLLPVNAHKQLVVIDFEYANANLPGLEFANHFTEWCYNYADARKPYAFHPRWYPTREEQERFIRAYVRHRPQFNVSTPKLGPTTQFSQSSSSIDTLSRRPTSSISDFMADVRTPQGGPATPTAEDAAHKAAEDQDVARLMRETRLWRLANTAQWVAWGVIQAKVPGMPDFGSDEKNKSGSNGEDESREDLGERGEEYRELAELQQQVTESVEKDEPEEAEDEFDYLGYAQHRAMFFWADAIQIGLVKAEELSEELRGKVKSVPY